jgi:hypothetical protein
VRCLSTGNGLSQFQISKDRRTVFRLWFRRKNAGWQNNVTAFAAPASLAFRIFSVFAVTVFHPITFPFNDNNFAVVQKPVKNG